MFDKTGKLNKNEFKFNGETLENVRQYKYLGVTFCISGSFSVASSELYKKALKGIFKLKSIFGSMCPKSSVAFHIFDHTIKPILTYGSEIWASMNKSVRSGDIIDNLYQNLHGEKLHTKFCKYVLGVHSKASNIACVGELGRFPIYIDICNDILKYYCYASHKPNDSLIGQALLTSKALYQSGVKSWFGGVDTILKELDLNETNCSHAKWSLICRYKDLWRLKLENEALVKKGKLRTFYTFKSTFQKEIYLDTLMNRIHQKSLTKLRISAHKLEIENGRYSRKSVGDRVCKKCNYNKVEDEIHFICECSLYNAERIRLFEYVNHKIPNFVSLNSHDKFIWLMTCENSDILSRFAEFVYKCFSLRDPA